LGRITGDLPHNWEDLIPESFPASATASRKSAGLVCNPLAQNIPSFMVGTADLSPSVHMSWPGKVDFQSVSLSVDDHTKLAHVPGSLILKQLAASMETMVEDTFITASESMLWRPSPTDWQLTIVEPLSQSHQVSSCFIW